MKEYLKKAFNKGILTMIDLMDHPFYIIKTDKNIKCTCLQEGTDEPRPECPKCLGTGYKVIIESAHGASQESSAPSVMRTTTSYVVARDYYIPVDYFLDKDDIIVDNNEAYIVVQYSLYSSFDGNPGYRKYNCIIKKLDSDIFIKNFNDIIK